MPDLVCFRDRRLCIRRIVLNRLAGAVVVVDAGIVADVARADCAGGKLETSVDRTRQGVKQTHSVFVLCKATASAAQDEIVARIDFGACPISRHAFCFSLGISLILFVCSVF